MSFSEKIKTMDNTIEQNKARYNLDRQAAKISALLSGNVGKYEFLTDKDVLPEKDLLEKAATIKKFEYSPLSSELKKKQIDIAKDEYKLFKDQINVINNNREYRVKTEDGKIIDNIPYKYIDDKYKV